MQTIAFYNHKGGVGKTTLLFNLGIALQSQGKKVLFVDGDAQANLTSIALRDEQIEEVYDSEQTIYHGLAPLVEGSGDIEIVRPIEIRDNAWVLPGHINLSVFEEIAPEGWTSALAGNPRGFRVSTAVHRLTRGVAAQVGAEYILLDLGPNVGAFNRAALLAADGFVIPMSPDLFSLTALPSVGESVSRWVDEWRIATNSASRRGLKLGFDLPVGSPVPLGYISQQFAVYREQPAKAYKRWVNQIPAQYVAGVVEPLAEAGVRHPEREGKIGEVRNLSSLIPMAQRNRSAVFELTGTLARGAQFTRARDTYNLFADLAGEVLNRLDETL
ncbi:ParA family protein [Litorihabitans aurantiacus]|uniref:Phage-related regulatory protein n=1 Tax=Litorihabitans aurantiacus TaxID=1930061 RepID=A0AA37XIA5_9MICO|nr:ParA family protein [Litorihabitans aurantiacus]GMA33639.1 phage-related regulatory protein [Litorihabitans aurantiacus]GMA33706.1 phage-related regulatory protein [Litorihabitans aurantiacus]GMA33769.1 phage-related regulatory protein [Litorihabitans aurantiacus]